MAAEVILNVRSRSKEELGSAASRRLRRAGEVPATIYGQGEASRSAVVNARELRQALTTDAGANVLITLSFDDDSTDLAMARDLVRHPVQDIYTHLDFLRVSRTEKVTAEVMVHIEGEPIGVKEEGGIIEQQIHAVQVLALPGDVPESLKLDIADLHVGDQAIVSDICVPDSVEILNDPGTVIVSLVTTRAVVAALEEEGGEEAGEDGDGEAAAEKD